MRPVILSLTSMILMSASLFAAELPGVDALPAVKEFPDALTTLAGKKIASKEQWLDERRPELKAIFQHYMYGPIPSVPTKIEAKVEFEDREAFGGKGTLREVTLTLAEGCPPIHLLLATPNGAKSPAPAFVGLNFSGNHSLVADQRVRIPDCWMYPSYKGVKNNRASEAGRGAHAETWSLRQSIDRGYAVATFYNGDVDPDDTKVRGGMQPFLKSKGVETSTIMAWAWGIMRAVDYLITMPEIDAKRIAVVGHSRLGKTAIVAAAFDERIALSIPHQAGTGGSAPNRSKNDKAEPVKRINTSFPHWFNATYKQFNEHVDKMPFDQHCLVALVAPRPVLFTNAIEDQWANPDGQFDILKAAEPVYTLFGKKGLNVEQRPEPGKLVGESLGYFIRAGKHSMTPEDWRVFLEFADRHFK